MEDIAAPYFFIFLMGKDHSIRHSNIKTAHFM